ncbi:YadA-like family protein [Sneathia sanguinegens]|uniref:YadA-like family protein n=1 Tax=Sneathia sanguinegens TaxID=40543 RepID=A0ABT7HHL5_9FUSO|nr:YadA-like family protein [Sneathia sanguinegens]MDK9580013.1 YadA-like family protein [Sneathia sanguinegens]
MQKSAVVCLAISILASVSYAADSNTTTEGAYNLIFNSSVNNKINGHDNVVGGNYNEVNDEFLDIAIANKTKNEEEIKKAISDKLVKEYKEVLAIVKANKAKSDGEILNAIKESKGIKSYEIVKYNFSLINGIIKNVKEGKLTKDEDILYKAFDPYDIYNKNVIKKVIEKKDKDDKEIKTDLVKSGNYFNNTLLGYSNKAKNSMRSVVIGDGAEVENSNSDGNVAIGNSAKAKGQAATAVGPRSSALNDTTTALGYGTMSLGKGSTTVGSNATAYGTYGLALGTNSKVIGEQGTALGYSAEVFGEGSVALGSSSRAYKASDKDGYRPYSAIDGKYKGITREKLIEIAQKDRKKLPEAMEAMKNDRVWKANLGVVSIGDPRYGTRQIANVAAGYYDTDAVNVAQLKELKTYVDNSTPFEYATTEGKSLYKFKNKYYTLDNKEYTGEVKIKAKELFKLSNIKSSLNDKNTNETTPSENSSDKNDVLVVEDLDNIKKDIKELKDLKDKFNNVSEKSNLAVSGISNAVAMSNLPQVNEESKYNLSAAYGYYGSSHSVAVGFSGTNNRRNVVYKLSGSINSFGHIAVGLGVGVAIKKYDKSIENLSKVEREFKEYKEQSERQIKEYKERLERLEKALLELKK